MMDSSKEFMKPFLLAFAEPIGSHSDAALAQEFRPTFDQIENRLATVVSETRFTKVNQETTDDE